MSGTVVAMQVYVDGSLKYQANGANVDTQLAIGTGSHQIVVQSWNNSGQYAKSSPIVVTVSATNSGTVPSTASGVSVSLPTPDSTTDAPLHVVATASMSAPVTAMQVYVDDKLLFKNNSNSIDTYLTNVSTGSHKVVVQSWDNAGRYAKSSPLYVTVNLGSSIPPTTSAPSGAATYSQIEQMGGWQSCDSCAGPGGVGPKTPYTMTAGQSSPSMDGNSAKFWLGGSTPYSAALWWKQLGANDNVKNFIYDLYFYYTDANAPQALEFDLNQSVGGYKYIFGTQCNPRGTGAWDIWDNVNAKWVSTGIACPAPPTYTWNHLTLEFQRTNDKKLNFVAVTLNGKKSYINRYYAPRAVSARELNVAFQMDGNYVNKNYIVWLDQVKLTAW